ncbi:MAG: ABC transporter permease [Tissierellaceae bacterium]|jgi:iron complex transport system permease protein|nr:iron chelate uptake ABC transporter family permease subunit [Tissierellia bacterium]
MKNFLMLLALLVLSIFSLLIGVSDVSLIDLFNLSNEGLNIMLLTRLPRLVSIIVAGVGMSISGLIMQQISRNKFVSPTTATTVDSAKLGVLVALIIFSDASPVNKMLIAFAFSMAGTFLFMYVLRRIKFKNIVFVPLVGLVLGSIIDSISTYMAYSFDLIQNVNTWLMGDFSMIIKGRYELLYISIPLIIVAYIYANKFTIVGMGEEFSINLGLNYDQILNIGIGIVAMITSLVLITVGRIPFLGLIIPNIVTIFMGDNMKKNIIPTALFGAIFLLLSDILGRLIIYPYEVSISLIVGVIGSLIFLLLLKRGDR